MLANMARNDLPVLRIGVSQYVLNKVIAILITGDIDEGNSRTVESTLTDAIQITTQKLYTTYFEALFDNLGSELIHAVFRSISNDMINSTAAVSWSAMLADMLDTPVAKLTVGHDIDACKYLFNARTL
jgi:hypothetical protein